ncbi:hypothetical protein DSECCO2_551380 [anaerobic digester metagenome]
MVCIFSPICQPVGVRIRIAVTGSKRRFNRQRQSIGILISACAAAANSIAVGVNAITAYISGSRMNGVVAIIAIACSNCPAIGIIVLGK